MVPLSFSQCQEAEKLLLLSVCVLFAPFISELLCKLSSQKVFKAVFLSSVTVEENK